MHPFLFSIVGISMCIALLLHTVIDFEAYISFSLCGLGCGCTCVQGEQFYILQLPALTCVQKRKYNCYIMVNKFMATQS